MAENEAAAVAVAQDGSLPVDTLRDAIPHLRRPFTPEAVRFKVQTVFKDAAGCLVVAYIDARLVIERLNLVVPDMWTATYEPIEGTKLAWCRITILRNRQPLYVTGADGPMRLAEDLTRSDVGESPKGMSKDLVSDSLKRAAVHFGVGVSIYALPQITLKAAQKHVEQRKTAKGPTLVLTEYGHLKLREGYAKWLEEHGKAKFGEPLDHGDVEGATVEEEPDGDEFAPEPAPALEDDKAKTLTAAITAEYDKLRAADPQRVPPAKFNAWLSGAAHSHEQLDQLLHYLRSQREAVA